MIIRIPDANATLASPASTAVDAGAPVFRLPTSQVGETPWQDGRRVGAEVPARRGSVGCDPGEDDLDQMELIAPRVIVPMAIASLVTGVAISLGTKWGLFRHYWVMISLVFTVIATVVLLMETATIRGFADLARESTVSGTRVVSLGSTLVHSIGGMVVLIAVLVLNIYKPRGMTAYGWRKMQE